MELIYEPLEATRWGATGFLIGGCGLTSHLYLSADTRSKKASPLALGWIIFSLGALHALWLELPQIQAVFAPDTTIGTYWVCAASLLLMVRIISSIIIPRNQAVKDKQCRKNHEGVKDFMRERGNDGKS